MRGFMTWVCVLASISVGSLTFSSTPSGRRVVIKIPDFEDGTWQCGRAKEMIWGPTRFCAFQNDPRIKGMEIRLPWDGTPIYRLWGQPDRTYHALWILKDQRWTEAVRGDNIEWIPRIINGRLSGFILMIFKTGSKKPFAYESFPDPDEADRDAPLPRPSLPATLFERS